MMAPTNITASATATIVSATRLRARLGLALCKGNKLFGARRWLCCRQLVSQEPHIVQADSARVRRSVALNVHNRHAVRRTERSMRLPRRKILQLTAGSAAFSAMPRIARAETYPARPVHIIVGFPPGAASDINARLVGDWLSQ